MISEELAVTGLIIKKKEMISEELGITGLSCLKK